MPDKPKPGSAEAVDQGCECAIMDNHYGNGIILNGERVWWINAECPLHGIGQPLPHSEDDA